MLLKYFAEKQYITEDFLKFIKVVDLMSELDLFIIPDI